MSTVDRNIIRSAHAIDNNAVLITMFSPHPPFLCNVEVLLNGRLAHERRRVISTLHKWGGGGALKGGKGVVH